MAGFSSSLSVLRSPGSPPQRPERRQARRPLVGLVATGLALEAVWVWFFLRPMSLLERTGPQLAPEPFVAALPPGGEGLARFLLAWVLLFGLYFLALGLVGRAGGRDLLVVAAAFGALYAVTFWPAIALGSTDLYHYILDGRALALHGGNPLARPPVDFWHDELAGILYYNTENTGAYGPLFYALAAGAALLGQGSLVWSTVAMKGLALLWLSGCFPLVYAVGERVRRGGGAAALLAFTWNPLVVFEAAGSGHNDIGVAFFGLLALWLALSGRWRWAPVALALGLLVKPTALLFLPPLLAWLWFQPLRPTARELFASLGAAAAVVVVAYAPFWAGAATFSQLRHLATLRMNSPADAAVVLLEARLSSDEAVRVIKLACAGAFLVAAGLVLAGTRGPRPAALPRAAFWCLFAYLMLTSWWFWPWYLLPLAAAGAVLWPGREGRLLAVFSCTALLLYAPLGWRETLFTYQNGVSQAVGVALIVFLAPALVWASDWWGTGAAERTA